MVYKDKLLLVLWYTVAPRIPTNPSPLPLCGSVQVLDAGSYPSDPHPSPTSTHDAWDTDGSAQPLQHPDRTGPRPAVVLDYGTDATSFAVVVNHGTDAKSSADAVDPGYPEFVDQSTAPTSFADTPPGIAGEQSPDLPPDLASSEDTTPIFGDQVPYPPTSYNPAATRRSFTTYRCYLDRWN